MSKAWIRAKRPEFVRDVLRDFCLVSRLLEEQFAHFDRSGQIAFTVLRDLLGEEMSKGLLWRLKDTAHHLFRGGRDPRRVGQFLDWGMGYVFHETIKLKEDAYQQQNYGPWFRSMQTEELPPQESMVARELYQVLLQTAESMRREIERIRFISRHIVKLMPLYLSAHSDNALLARLLYDQRDLIRDVFAAEYDGLIAAIYGADPVRMYVLAAQSLRQGGWLQEAETAIEDALRLEPGSPRVLQEREIVDSWRKRLKS